MHHLRGLVRPVSHRLLTSLTTARVTRWQDCVREARLVDCHGTEELGRLLHSDAFLSLLGTQSIEGALAMLAETRSWLSQALPPSTDRAHATRNSDGADAAKLPLLYVRQTSHATRRELQARQLRLLYKLEGTWHARSMDAVDRVVQGMLRAHAHSELYKTEEEAMYNGIVQGLCAHDESAALALAINPRLPALHPRTAIALAAMVELRTQSAVLSFLESFAGKDERAAAYRTCATQLAVRLRNALSTHATRNTTSAAQVDTKGTEQDDDHASLIAGLRACAQFNIDPAVVYPTDAAAIQRWASQMLQPDMLPLQRSHVLLDAATHRQLLPRRVSMNALSAWCLCDLERPWLRHVLGNTDGGSGGTGSISSSRDGEEGSGAVAASAAARDESTVDVVVRAAATSLVLKEPRRNLVDNRLLHDYATLLAKGEISAADPHAGFAAFLEECGECHDARERPRRLCFTVPAVAARPVGQTLRDLAPRCGYWCTLLDHMPHLVRVRAAPFGDLYVEVDLPRAHECVTAAMSVADKSAPRAGLGVLYEDADLLVLNKAAGLATSRHALSCTQLGDPAVTDVVSLLLHSNDGRQLALLPRQGQVHRLDIETSGCLVVAKTLVAADSLRHQMGTGGAFAHHGKVYLALCVVLEPELVRVPLHGTLVDPTDPKIRTQYRIVRFFRAPRLALVECRLPQGKKHQVRRHLAAAGLPLVGDLVHGGAACCRPLLSRVALHARSIHIIHPTLACGMTFAAPLPPDFQAALSVLCTA